MIDLKDFVRPPVLLALAGSAALGFAAGYLLGRDPQVLRRVVAAAARGWEQTRLSLAEAREDLADQWAEATAAARHDIEEHPTSGPRRPPPPATTSKSTPLPGRRRRPRPPPLTSPHSPPGKSANRCRSRGAAPRPRRLAEAHAPGARRTERAPAGRRPSQPAANERPRTSILRSQREGRLVGLHRMRRR